MKRLFLLILLLVGLVLTGCEQTRLPPEPTTVPTVEATTESTSASTSAPTVPTTVPTAEPTVPPTEPAPPKWLREEAYPTYEEFFAEDRQYELFRYPYNETYVHSQLCSWYMMEGNVGTEYVLNLEYSYAGGIASLYLTDMSTGNREPFMIGKNFDGYELLTCDGRYAYLSKWGDHPSWAVEIARLDMENQTLKTIFQGGKIMDLYICGDKVAYFACAEGGSVQICRIYLPEEKLDILTSFSMAPGMFTSLDRPAGTLADVTWTAIDPQMQLLVEAELNDSKSVYKSYGGVDEIYSTTQPLQEPAWRGEVRLLSSYISMDNQMPDRYIGTYRCADGTVSEKTVVSETVSQAPEPVAVKGDWQVSGANIQGTPKAEKPGETAVSLILGSGFSTGNPGCYYEGKVTRLSEDVVRETAEGADGVYCITEENTVVQLAWDGSVRNVLYDGGDTRLEQLVCREGFVYLLRGDEILEIDVAEGKYRVLIRQPGIYRMDLINPEGNGLYFRAGGYLANIYWFESGRFDETSG